jgi:hypothetical protein
VWILASNRIPIFHEEHLLLHSEAKLRFEILKHHPSRHCACVCKDFNQEFHGEEITHGTFSAYLNGPCRSENSSALENRGCPYFKQTF